MSRSSDFVACEDDALLHDQIVPAFAAMLGGEVLPDDPAELEQIAATLLVPLEHAGLPADVSTALLAEIERQADASAAALLEAVAVIAGEPLASRAREAAGRLGDAGIVSPAAGKLGTLAVREAVHIDGGDADMLIALLRRPGSRKTQLALLGIDRTATGGALASCLLTSPIGVARARSIVEDAATDERSSSSQPITAQQLTARVRAAAQRAVDLGLQLDADSSIALPLIARALTGDPHGLARPQAIAPWEDDDDELIVDAAEDEDGFHDVMELLLDELEQHTKEVCPTSSPMWSSGHFVATCMLEWKGLYDDGCLGRWTADDLAELLLDYFPRKVSAAPETLDVVPECVLGFLGFLDARGSLSGEPLEELEQVCLALREPFRERIDDPAGWGLAKSMAMQMLTEGIDADDPAALETWLADFNARPVAERDAVLGGVMDRMTGATSPAPDGGGSRTSKRNKQRKAQRSARKRNRPRR